MGRTTLKQHKVQKRSRPAAIRTGLTCLSDTERRTQNLSVPYLLRLRLPVCHLLFWSLIPTP